MASIECPHKQHLLFKSDTVIKFPSKRWERRFKEHGLPLQARHLLPLARLYGALPPEGFSQRYHCEKVTQYQHKAKVVYVLKV
jgi:hypothetical protein